MADTSRGVKPIRLSIGSWAYCFGPYQDNPVPFEMVIEKLGRLDFDGVELGGFPPHPDPALFNTKAKRDELKKKVAGYGLAFSGLAADLGIDCIRVDAVSPPDIFEKEKIDPMLGWERLVDTFRTAAGKAGDRGVRVVYEFEPGFAFNKPSEIMRLVDDVGHRNFRLLFDTSHGVRRQE